MTTAEVLQKARDLIADESRWTRGSYAKDAAGEPVDPLDPSACRHCALGAVLLVSGTRFEDEEFCPAVVALEECLPFDHRGRKSSVPTVNDIDGHEAVLALFASAIAEAS